MILCLLLSLFAIFYIWVVFPVFMWLWSRLFPRKMEYRSNNSSLTVIIPALNEEDRIQQRIENIYASQYPSHLIQVIVISDGSSDNTASVARQTISEEYRVLVLENQDKSGRAFSHNRSVEYAEGEILVFTDAGTSFEEGFLREISNSFADPRVGFASGALCHVNAKSTEIAEAASLYWKFEQNLRVWESKSGLNAVGSGPCCAMRASLYLDIPSTGDVDFTSPLDAVLQGKMCIHIPEAIAFDEITSGAANELKARIRMTSKNFRGTFGRWGIKGFLKKPLHSWVLASHKYGRWLTPFLMLSVLICSIGGWIMDGGLYWSVLILIQLSFYGLGVAGSFGARIPLAKTVYSFLLGNVGMFIGVVQVVRGAVPATYTPIRND